MGRPPPRSNPEWIRVPGGGQEALAYRVDKRRSTEQIQASGHQYQCQTNQEVRDLIRSLAALAFLPTDQVVQEFHNLGQEQHQNSLLLDVKFQYFATNWIDGCPLSRWNV
eukprot:scpid111798/ scgid4533/ 